MFLDYHKEPATCARYTVYDPDTGRCMDNDPLVIVDTDRGFYDIQDSQDGTVLFDAKGRPVIKRIRRRLAVFTRPEYIQDDPCEP